MKSVPILYWSRKTNNDTEYQLARKTISSVHGVMPEVIAGEYDIVELLSKNPDSVLYYPVFCGSTGWWGEFLGGQASVTDKIIISPECQLMAIEMGSIQPKKGQNQLLAAEIYPTSGFFKKMNSSVATVVDMLATDAGTILALFSGKSHTQLVNILESTGNSYLGCIGRY
ncbi:MAG TPA: hypothetical protein PKJ33_03920 [Alphaproteobacteria bacterium]|nr:hypothetical protein [Alphaproteobacteria bacterium]